MLINFWLTLIIFFGIPLTSAILEGEEVNWKDFAYHVKVFARERRVGKHLDSQPPVTCCTGTVISPSLVLTATECIHNGTTTKNLDEILVIFVKERLVAKRIAGYVVEKTDTWSLLKLRRALNVEELCPKHRDVKRLAQLNLRLSLLKKSVIDIDEADLKNQNCSILGFKTTQNSKDFYKQETLLKVDLASLQRSEKKSEERVLYANVTDNHAACWDDIGSAVTCSFPDGDYQVGIVHQLLALPSKIKELEDLDEAHLNLATCATVAQIKVISILNDERLLRAVERYDFAGFVSAYSACERMEQSHTVRGTFV